MTSLEHMNFLGKIKKGGLIFKSFHIFCVTVLVFNMSFAGVFFSTIDALAQDLELTQVCSDIDSDGICDDQDGCPDDPSKVDPGVCGCGIEDNDSDGDGTYDCEDMCQDDPNKTDEGVCGCGTEDIDLDDDGTYDCEDACPKDPSKTEEGVCGCGYIEADEDQDTVVDCVDNCPYTYNPDQTDSNGNQIGDACDDVDEPNYGCTDPEAINYDPQAEKDDQSCEYIDTPAYCGDGLVNQQWEECDGQDNNSNYSCSEQCQFEDDVCDPNVYARVNVPRDGVTNGPEGDMTPDIFVGSDSYYVSQGTWFPIAFDGTSIEDMDVSNYEDVPGLAFERLDGSVRVVLYGSRSGDAENIKEHIDGDIEFYNARVSDQRDDKSNDKPKSNKLEKGFDGNGIGSYNAGNDEVWMDSAYDNYSYFWLTTTTADDGFYTDWERLEDCEIVCEEGPVDLLNPSFETPQVDGWELLDSTEVLWSVGPADLELHNAVKATWTASDGDQYAELGSTEAVEISQSVETFVDASYRLSYDFSPRPGVESNVINVLVDDSLVATHSEDGGGDGNAATSWTTYTYEFVADSDETKIAFADASIPDSYGTYIDNISLELIDCIAQDPQPECDYDIEGYKLHANDEINLSGWGIELYSGDEFVASTTTDDNGWYTFSDLCSGEYQVHEQMQDGWRQVYPVEETGKEYCEVLLGEDPQDDSRARISDDKDLADARCNFVNEPGICGYKYNYNTESSVEAWDIYLKEVTVCEEGDQYADSVVDYSQGLQRNGDPVKVIRSVPEQGLVYEDAQSETSFFSLGFGGWIVVEFDNPITNNNGPDFDIKVTEDTWGGGYPSETADVFASQDSINWTYLGEVDNSHLDQIHTTFELDLGELAWATYIKVVDTSDPADFDNHPTADGYDLNAIEGLECSGTSELIVAETATDENGWYCFFPEAGEYRVEERIGGDWQYGDWDYYEYYYEDLVFDGLEPSLVDFWNIPPDDPSCDLSIKGYVYHDNTEEGLEDWTVALFQDDALVATTTTDEFGFYIFENLEEGSYRVYEYLLDGWRQVYPLMDHGIEYFDVVLECDYRYVLDDTRYYTTSLGPNYNFYNEPGICGYKYNQNTGGKMSDWDIYLKIETATNTFQVLEATTTDESGQYCFYPDPGDYRVEERVEAGSDWVYAGWDYYLYYFVDDSFDGLDPWFVDFYNTPPSSGGNGYCGDGNLDSGETCDDGNNVNGDGCNKNCSTEKKGGGGGSTPLCVLRGDCGGTSNDDDPEEKDEPAKEPNLVEETLVLGETGEALMTVTKTVSDSVANPGDILTYTVTVSNDGEIALFNTVLSDFLQDGLEFKEDESSAFKWELGDILPQQSITKEYEVMVLDSVVEGVFKNTATASADNHDDVSASATVDVEFVLVLAETGISLTELYVLAVSAITLAVSSRRLRRRYNY